MKKLFLSLLLCFSLGTRAQTVMGYWYGYANVKTIGSTNNYMIELILQQDKNAVKGILNYYFRETYRSIEVRGEYNEATRQLVLNSVPLIYHGSIDEFEVDCIMNMLGTLRVAKAGSNLFGSFVGSSDYKYTCKDVVFTLKLKDDISKKDSVQKAISEFKETYQVWEPTPSDTFVAANIIPRQMINPKIEKEYTKRENIVATDVGVSSNVLKVDFYDNGEIDGDSISVFLNNKLIAFHQRLGAQAIHFDLKLDTLLEVNELTMFAENLGTIPPNTALMIVTDGSKRYNIRLSSTLEKNATIRIKRKKPAP